MIPQKIDRYEITRELGRGGMATVYQAFDPRFKREVAVKVLPPEFLHDPKFQARFEREAQTIAALEYPGIVPVYDFGEDGESGQLYIVMRLMTGGSLADRLAQGPLQLAETARIFSQLAPALDKAHAKGITHRDLKPGNILFDADHNPYISDFGIVKLAEATSTFTGSGVIGTPAYMSPEQARGNKSIDGRSDIYALGAILFTLLTGTQPYEADTPMGVVVKHITEPTPRILETRPDLPPGIDAVIQKTMAKERAARFSTVQELADALAGAVKEKPVESLPTLKAAGLPETTPEQISTVQELADVPAGAIKKAPVEALDTVKTDGPPVTTPERPISPTPKGRWWLYGLIGLILISAGVAIWLGRRPQAPAAVALLETASHSPTDTSTTAPTQTLSPSPTAATPTSMPSATQAITLTPTRHPTRTATPPPDWVLNFAQPILDSITGQEPTLQDDFSQPSPVWKVDPMFKLSFANGELTLASGPTYHSTQIWRDIWIPHVVIELDYRFLPGTPANERWGLYYRVANDDERYGGHVYHFYQSGDVEVTLWGTRPDGGPLGRFQNAALSGGAANHVLLIAKGHEFALYLNGQPTFYKQTDPIFLNGGILFDMNAQQVAIDNFKLWELSGE